jgi:hypothetical protein
MSYLPAWVARFSVSGALLLASVAGAARGWKW